MSTLKNFLPEASDVERAPIPELAGALLELLRTGQCSGLNRRNFIGQIGDQYTEPREGPHEGVMNACSEAWCWLVTEGFLCDQPQQGDDWMRLTRKAQALSGHEGFARWVASQELPEAMLVEGLRGLTRSLFLQGHYETSVFEAFKTLEVSMRDAASLGPDLVGVALASRAFNPDNGQLTDMEVERGERVALMSLMTGAIGSYKNPHGHRRLQVAAAEAREMLFLASHLLRIVDARALLGLRSHLPTGRNVAWMDGNTDQISTA